MFLTNLKFFGMIKEIISPVISYTKYNTIMSKTYEEAINCLNSLQSNYSYIQNVINKGVVPHSETHSTTIAETQKYLLRTGITLEQLDKLSIIHVAGTKGKGSTCAFCDNIIRQYGYKTGFYSSPHLIEVRERIKLNGKPLSREIFAENIFKIYNHLMDKRDHEHDMPSYFRFLTILAFNIFISEKVDVAVIEVGIGGEYDCTNVVRNTPIVGITSLGIDHVSMLGNTLEQIAWQKAGIIKKHSKVYTVQQSDIAMETIKHRSVEKDVSSFVIVPDFDKYNWNNNKPELGINGTIQKLNASLAIQLAHNWIKYCGKDNNMIDNDLTVPEETIIGLKSCKWPGRNQILKTSKHTFYLDGAHTIDSLELSAKWYQTITNNIEKRVLIFNAIGDRNSVELLKKLITIDFDTVMFVPNIASSESPADQTNLVNIEDSQITRCHLHKNLWIQLQTDNSLQKIYVFPSVEDAIATLSTNFEYHVLVTGSLHLVGAALTILDPELKSF